MRNLRHATNGAFKVDAGIGINHLLDPTHIQGGGFVAAGIGIYTFKAATGAVIKIARVGFGFYLGGLIFSAINKGFFYRGADFLDSSIAVGVVLKGAGARFANSMVALGIFVNRTACCLLLLMSACPAVWV
ncbi:MAG: hypothetical protein U5M23_05400 [Marinagarivorans sp.]|nr:hypothetical protein [Marinagarivorans sp.]